MNRIIQSPINNSDINLRTLEQYSTYIFLSPHLDDAIFSCGDLITQLSNMNKEVIVVTIFTNASTVSSPQAKDFLHACGYDDEYKLFKNRKLEDIKACTILGAKYKHFHYIDAAWRNYEGRPIYQSVEKQYSGKISNKDKLLVNKLMSEFKKLIDHNKNVTVFAPLGMGNHVDHLIVNTVARKVTKNIFFWEDFPYNRSIKNRLMFLLLNREYRQTFSSRNIYTSKKLLAIKKYRSQIDAILKGKFIFKKERYYSYNK